MVLKNEYSVYSKYMFKAVLCLRPDPEGLCSVLLLLQSIFMRIYVTTAHTDLLEDLNKML